MIYGAAASGISCNDAYLRSLVEMVQASYRIPMCTYEEFKNAVLGVE
jgi:hypothetical protein